MATVVKNICCIGAGYVGGPTMAVLALKNPNFKFTVCDISQHQIDRWCSTDLPIDEPGLWEVVEEVRDKNLYFTTNVADSVRSSDIVFIAVNTPTKMAGAGAGAATDMSFWEAAAECIADNLGNGKIIVEKSTLPMETVSLLHDIIIDRSARDFTGAVPPFAIVSNPEFLAEGTAVKDLLEPDRVILGGSADAVAAVRALYSWVDTRVMELDVRSAKLAKLASNALLAQRLSSVNALATLCERTGADITAVTAAVGADSRIGARYLQAGLGWGGSCLRKDVLSLAYTCECAGLVAEANYWRAVSEYNQHTRERFARVVVRQLGSARGKRVALWGFAFKADTADARDTPAAEVVLECLRAGVSVCVWDERVPRREVERELRARLAEAGTGAGGSRGWPGGYGDEVGTAESASDDKSSGRGVQKTVDSSGWGGVDRSALGYAVQATSIRGVSLAENLLASAEGAQCVAVATEWVTVRDMCEEQWRTVYARMRQPAYVLDGRGVVDATMLERIGFRVYKVGTQPGVHVELG